MGSGQTIFAYATHELMQVELLLSKERLTPYLSESQGDTKKAIRLYERNTLLAESLHGVLQGAEIAVRNSIHNVMISGLIHTNWYDYVPWNSPEADSLDRAKYKILHRKKIVSPGRVIAELTFGFWLQTMSRKYEKLLWVPYIHKAFPNITTDRDGLFHRMDGLRNLRNRIAHHERIIHFNLLAEYLKTLELVSWICPVTSSWINTANRFRKP